jgi:hypothetical protein
MVSAIRLLGQAAKAVGSAPSAAVSAAAPSLKEVTRAGHVRMTANGPVAVAPHKTHVMASPEEIERAAKETAKGGMAYHEIRTVYANLGLTGGPVSPLVKASLLPHATPKIEAARLLKLADRKAMESLSAEQREMFRLKGSAPGFVLPSQEAAAADVAAFAMVRKQVKLAESQYDAAMRNGMPPNGLPFDTSVAALTKTPDVPQFLLPRAAVKETERTAFANRGGVKRLTDAAGSAPAANAGWYNLEQMRSRFHQIHGPEKGPQAYKAWIDSLAGTSMVNPIDSNVRGSFYYLSRVLKEKPLPQIIKVDDGSGKITQTLVGGPAAGYGAKSQVQHAGRVREYMTNQANPIFNPKPLSYHQNLSGNWRPTTVDTHEIRNAVGMKRASLFGENAGMLPGEYAHLELIGQKASKQMGLPNASRQALTWVGGGSVTGLKSHPAPLMEVMNRRAWVTGQVRGITPGEAMDRAIRGEQPLLGVGATVGGTGMLYGASGGSKRLKRDEA